MSRPAFATPIAQSSRSDVLEWRFPKPYQQYVLTGKSRAAWHTSFVIPQLNLLLDAGLCVNKLRPKHIFLTHGHSDHTLLSPAFVKYDDPPDVYCPREMKRVFDHFIHANTMLNLGGVLELDGCVEGRPSLATDIDGNSRGILDTHYTYGLRHGEVVPLRRLKNIHAIAFDCHHTVPCLGYVFCMTTNRLKPEYSSVPGQELKTLRQSGVEITAPHTTPIFAFLGDTTAATLAAGPSWLEEGIAVVITECSFLYEEHRDQAVKTKHTFWADLEKVVRRWPKTTFVVMHFSLRYSDEEIRRFFADMEDPPQNLVVWIDGEGDGFGLK